MKLYENSLDYKLEVWDIETVKCYFIANNYKIV